MACTRKSVEFAEQKSRQELENAQKACQKLESEIKSLRSELKQGKQERESVELQIKALRSETAQAQATAAKLKIDKEDL